MSRRKLLILGKNEGILMRPDGTRVKGLTPIVQALPHIMPKRYDAQNWASDYVDEDILKTYIRQKRREGRLVTHMSVIVAAYYKAALENPKVNYFIMNRKVYKRNHFCFSFVILKTRADGTPDETCIKIFLDPEDDVFTISQKMKEHIDRNYEILVFLDCIFAKAKLSFQMNAMEPEIRQDGKLLNNPAVFAPVFAALINDKYFYSHELEVIRTVQKNDSIEVFLKENKKREKI